MGLDIQKIREEFPILQEKIHGKPLVYFDNAATTQKPLSVLNIMDEYYRKYNSNIHRGIHHLSEKCTTSHEAGRKTIQQFINARSPAEVIFTRGTTESINLVASSFGERFVSAEDEIIVTEMEHHSNIVPWQLLCERKNAVLKHIPINDAGELILDELDRLITDKTRIISVMQVSNALGTVNPVKKIIETAHRADIPVLVDGAQAIQHTAVDVQELDCDFYAFSGHKMYGPTGIGVLYGKEKWLDAMPPYQGGGEMIEKVTLGKTTFNELPFKFEAGTPNYINAIGMEKAVQFISTLGLPNIEQHEQDLLNYATERLSSIEGMRIYGTASKKSGALSFLMDNIHYYDLAMVLDKMGIALRTGTHCAEPLMQHYGITGTARASFGVYNTKEEVDILYGGLKKAKEMFG